MGHRLAHLLPKIEREREIEREKFKLQMSL